MSIFRSVIRISHSMSTITTDFFRSKGFSFQAKQEHGLRFSVFLEYSYRSGQCDNRFLRLRYNVILYSFRGNLCFPELHWMLHINQSFLSLFTFNIFSLYEVISLHSLYVSIEKIACTRTLRKVKAYLF